MSAIKTEKLTKKYGEKIAVNELSLDISEGEFFSLLGVNGAGKTTTIKMLTGLTEPTSGNAFIMGLNLKKDLHQIKQLTNASPQETAVAPNLSAMENLLLIAGIYGLNKKEAISRANEVIEELGLEEIKNSRASKLSGGWMRRLSIAMALITRPQVLFLDEPTLGLDVIARRELWDVISSLKGKVTVILTTHYLEEARELSDRIGIMAKGLLRAIGTTDELMKLAGKDNFEDAFVLLATGKESA